MRLKEIEAIAGGSLGVNDLDEPLERLLRYLLDHPESQSDAETALLAWAREWPDGALEAIEFTMHTLRWPTVRSFLEREARDNDDFRLRNLARKGLGAYAADWPDSDIYAYYREQ